MKKRDGYTLIETVIAIGILLTLSGTMLIYNRSTENQLFALRDQALITALLNQAKSFSVKRFNTPDACAFGVYFDISSSTLILFKDNLPPSSSSTDVFQCRDRLTGVYATNFKYDGIAEDITRIAIDPRLKLSLKYKTSGVINATEVVFIPPNPTATSTQVLPLLVSLKTRDNKFGAYTEISPVGQISTYSYEPY